LEIWVASPPWNMRLGISRLVWYLSSFLYGVRKDSESLIPLQK
jgi:hypothetical protein